MTLNRIARLLNVSAREVRDVNAIRRGRIGQRIANRVIGRTVARLLRGLWR